MKKIEIWEYTVEKAHKHTGYLGRHDRKIHVIPEGNIRIEVEAGTRGAAMTALRFTHSSCSKCPWVPALRDYPTGRCKDCDINWIWDKGAVAAKTEMQIGENGKKVADTVWVKKVTGEALNCQRCGTTQLVRTTRTVSYTHLTLPTKA